MLKFRKILALALAALTLLSVLPAPALAEGERGLSNFRPERTYEEGRFADVLHSDWYYENVKAAYELGLMVGREDGFGEAGDMTVAEAVTLSARLHAIYMGEDADFTQGTPWYGVYADYVTDNAIADLSGLDMTAPVTREQFAWLLCSAFPAEALEGVNSVAEGAIPDVKSGDRYAEEIYRLYRAGVLTGNDAEGAFTPDAPIKRREVGGPGKDGPVLRRLVCRPGVPRGGI